MRSYVVRLASSPNRTTMRRALLAGAAAVITLVVASACGASTGTDEQPPSPTGSTAAEMADLQQATGVDVDRMFSRMMMAHHNGAIQMCHDIAESGTNPDVKALAATIEQGQSAEVARLQTILDRL